MQTINYKIDGLTCGACFALVNRFVSRINGVTSVDIDKDGTMKIVAEREIKKNEVTAALAGTDFSVA